SPLQVLKKFTAEDAEDAEDQILERSSVFSMVSSRFATHMFIARRRSSSRVKAQGSKPKRKAQGYPRQSVPSEGREPFPCRVAGRPRLLRCRNPLVLFARFDLLPLLFERFREVEPRFVVLRIDLEGVLQLLDGFVVASPPGEKRAEPRLHA